MTPHADVPPTMRHNPQAMVRLPLPAELWLLAHHHDTGALHLHYQSLTVGLAGATLLDLSLSRHVAIGWDRDPTTRVWQPRPGAITITTGQRLGDPLRDAALDVVHSTRHHPSPHPHLHTWLRTLAQHNLYEQVRDDMITAGVLHQTVRRRLGVVPTTTYLATHTAYGVRARAFIREAVTPRTDREPPDEQCLALCGLVHTLDLVPFLHCGIDDNMIRKRLRNITGHDQALHEVLTAVNASRGDLALTAMR